MNKYIELILNDTKTEIDVTKITKEIIINLDEEYFESIKNYIIKSFKDMFSLYSPNSLEKESFHNFKWINEKNNYLKTMEYIYKIIYNDMLDRTAQYNNDDIVYFQMTFNNLFRKNKNILDGFIAR